MTVTRANNPSFYEKGFKVVMPKPKKESSMAKKKGGCKKGK